MPERYRLTISTLQVCVNNIDFDKKSYLSNLKNGNTPIMGSKLMGKWRKMDKPENHKYFNVLPEVYEYIFKEYEGFVIEYINCGEGLVILTNKIMDLKTIKTRVSIRLEKGKSIRFKKIRLNRDMMKIFDEEGRKRYEDYLYGDKIN